MAVAGDVEPLGTRERGNEDGMNEHLPSIAIIGGTGKLGGGLALRWTRAGYQVVIGSRSPDRAKHAAEMIGMEVGGSRISGMSNESAAAAGDIAVLTVPYAHHRDTLESIRSAVQGKIFVDTTVPLVPPRVSVVQLPKNGSVAREAQSFLGDTVRVVSAFQTIAAAQLREDPDDEHGHVLVCGNDPDARETVLGLVEAAGLRGWHAGVIDNSVVSEALTSVLIYVNRTYKMGHAGIHIVGRKK
jgi:NADPH-dependent F420 reductase